MVAQFERERGGCGTFGKVSPYIVKRCHNVACLPQALLFLSIPRAGLKDPKIGQITLFS